MGGGAGNKRTGASPVKKRLGGGGEGQHRIQSDENRCKEEEQERNSALGRRVGSLGASEGRRDWKPNALFSFIQILQSKGFPKGNPSRGGSGQPTGWPRNHSRHLSQEGMGCVFVSCCVHFQVT